MAVGAGLVEGEKGVGEWRGGRKLGKNARMPMFIQRSIEVEGQSPQRGVYKGSVRLLLENQNTPSPPERSNSRLDHGSAKTSY